MLLVKQSKKKKIWIIAWWVWVFSFIAFFILSPWVQTAMTGQNCNFWGGKERHLSPRKKFWIFWPGDDGEGLLSNIPLWYSITAVHLLGVFCHKKDFPPLWRWCRTLSWDMFLTWSPTAFRAFNWDFFFSPTSALFNAVWVCEVWISEVFSPAVVFIIVIDNTVWKLALLATTVPYKINSTWKHEFFKASRGVEWFFSVPEVHPQRMGMWCVGRQQIKETPNLLCSGELEPQEYKWLMKNNLSFQHWKQSRINSC